MTEEQVYAIIGRMAVKCARDLLCIGDLWPRGNPDACTIRILGMADMLDQMEEAGVFGTEAMEHELCSSGHIQWYDAEVCKPEVSEWVLTAFKSSAGSTTVATAYWLGDYWASSPDGSNRCFVAPLYWAPLNLPEEQS